MKTYIGLDSEGYIEGIVHTTGECPPGYKEYLGPVGTVPSGINRDGSWFMLPPKPSIHHVLNRQSREWVLPVEVVWTAVRMERDRLIQASDWTQLSDVPLSNQKEWADYRQALRDITTQADPTNIEWPIPPNI